MQSKENYGNVQRVQYLKNIHKEEAPFYKQLNESVRKARDTPFDKEAIHTLSTELATSNEHFKPYLQQAVLDSDFMVHSSYVANKRVQSLKTSHYEFSVNIFASRLMKAKNGFEKIGEEYGHYLQSVPSFNFMFGAFETQDVIKEKRKKKNSNVWKKDKAVQPKVWTNKDSSDEDTDDESTAHEVENLFKKLCKSYRENQKKPVNYFDFVTDECSFSSTVENIFYSSFLAKGGYTKLTKDGKDKRHKIEPMKKDEENERTQKPNHSILTFTKNDWFKWIEEY